MGDSSEAKAWDAAQKFLKLIKANAVPDYVCIEQAPKQAFKSIHPTIQLNVLAGAFCAVLGLYRIPCETVTDSTWRKAMYGNGRRKGWASADWKRLAKEHAQMLKIEIANADEAEAVQLAIPPEALTVRVTIAASGLSEGRIPPAIPATHRWDRKAIDEALDRLSGIKTNDGLSELEQWRLKKANARAS